jgi:MarR family transcriptional regulator, 2-MHQ and catechol-resistance regulon repressor
MKDEGPLRLSPEIRRKIEGDTSQMGLSHPSSFILHPSSFRGEVRMEPDKSEEMERALYLFRVLARCSNSVMRHAEQDIKQQGMKPSEFAVMELLYHKGPIPLTEVARRTLLTTGSITHVMDQLEEQGMVRRVACEKDRRVLHAELTEAGNAKIAATFPTHAERIREAVSGLEPGEQQQLILLLRKLGYSAEAMLGSKHPTDYP